MRSGPSFGSGETQLIDLLWLYREALHKKFYYFLIIINLSLGLVGYFTIESFRHSIESYGQSQKKNILGADLSVSARRPLTEEEEKFVSELRQKSIAETEVYSFFAMTVFKDRSKLSLAKVFGDGFPLYGEMTVGENDLPFSQAKDKPYVWLEPELITFFSLKNNDEVKIGNLTFTVAGAILKDGTSSFRFGGVAQRIYFHEKWLEGTGLIQFGSTFTKTRLFQFADEQQAKEAAKVLSASIQDLAVQIETADEVAQESLRPLQYLIDFLGLVGIVALFLSVLSSSYLLRVFINEQLSSIALLNCLGIGQGFTLRIFLIRSALISLFCVGLAGLVASIVTVTLGAKLKNAGILDMDIQFYWPILALGLLMTMIVSQFFWLPYFFSVMNIPGYALLRDSAISAKASFKYFVWYIPGFVSLWLLSVWTAHSWYRGSLFVAVLLAASVLILLLGRFFIFLLKYIRTQSDWRLRVGLSSLLDQPGSRVTLFLCLSLTTVLMSLLPQLEHSIKNEFIMDETTQRPALFLFDIQEEQLPQLRQLVEKYQGELVSLSPLIRARLLKVNENNFEKRIQASEVLTREEEQEARMRNRGLNLSYRSSLAQSESIIDGRPLEDHPDHVEFSIEQRYADRMGMKMGDQLTLDVQGVEVQGQVVNLRKVRWTSFEPNFFITVNESALKEAPKVWLTGVTSLNNEQKIAFQSELAQTISNISVIDVERVATDLFKWVDKISWAFSGMSYLTLIVGFFVLLSTLMIQIGQRRQEIELYSTLGASPNDLFQILNVEYVLIVVLSLLSGTLLSIGVSEILSLYIFDKHVLIDFSSLIKNVSLIGISALLILFLILFLFTNQANKKPEK